MTVTTKDLFVRKFTDSEVEAAKRAFYAEVDKFLEKRYTVALPLYAIKILIEACARDSIAHNQAMEDGGGFSNRENVLAEAKDKIAHIVAKELSKSGLNGKKFIHDIWDEVKEEMDREFADAVGRHKKGKKK